MTPFDLKHVPTQASHGLREKSSEASGSMPPDSPSFPVAIPSDTPFGHRFAALRQKTPEFGNERIQADSDSPGHERTLEADGDCQQAAWLRSGSRRTAD